MPPSARTRQTTTLRKRVLTVLEQHGLARTAATQARGAGGVLRDKMRRTALEWATFIDDQTGEQPGAHVAGEHERVRLDSLFRQCQPDRRYLAVHTHPQNLPFSLQDGAVLLEHPELSVIAAVGRDGSWHLLSVAPGQPIPSIKDMRSRMAAQLEVLNDNYTVPPYPGALTARRELWHTAWQRAAPALGLRYDRIRSDEESDAQGEPAPSIR